MKALLKFSLLSALIITGKLAKHSAPVATVQNMETQTAANSSVLFVHHVANSMPAGPTREQDQPQQSGSGLLAEMF